MANPGEPCAQTCGFSSSKGYYDCRAKLVCGSTSNTNNTTPNTTDNTTPNTTDNTTPNTSDPDEPCNGIDYAGKCQGDSVVWCENDALQTYSCAATGKSCGYKSSSKIYDCVDAPPAPTTTPNISNSCTDQCDVGERGCNGSTAWTCVKGSNGCYAKSSTSCGSNSCIHGVCIDANKTCYGIDSAGLCYANDLYFCKDQQLYKKSCSSDCGWLSSEGYYNCK